LGVDLIGALGE
jgi:hypothetical protein